MATYGIQFKHWIKAESSYGTHAAPVATDGLRVVSFEPEPKVDYHKSKEHVGSASLQKEFAGKRGGTYKLQVYERPNAAGTAPDYAPALASAYGATPTIVGGTSVSYALSSALSTACPSFEILRYAGDNFCEMFNGCWVEELLEEGKGGEEKLLTFSGGFANFGFLYGAPTTDNAGYLAGVGVVNLAAASAGKLGAGVRVKFGAEDNAGAGYLVTDVTGLAVTFTPVLAGGLAASALAVTPVVPAFTPSAVDTIVEEVNSGHTLDGSAIGVISYKLSLKTGFHGRDKEISSAVSLGILSGAREVTGELEYYFLDENAKMAGGAHGTGLYALVIRSGENVAAKRATMTIAKARVEPHAFKMPDAEEMTWTAKFVARQNAASDDELTKVYN